MLLVFTDVRPLTALVADAAKLDDTRREHDAAAPWRRASAVLATAPPRRPGSQGAPWSTAGVDADEPWGRHLRHLVEAVVVGRPEGLEEVLTEDATGWSPTFAFADRAAAEAAQRERPSSLSVRSFDVGALFWAEPLVFAEWHVEATVSDPMLVADDVLVEAAGRPVSLSGATVGRLRDGRLAVVHSYFDEASLIEQVVLPR